MVVQNDDEFDGIESVKNRQKTQTPGNSAIVPFFGDGEWVHVTLTQRLELWPPTNLGMKFGPWFFNGWLSIGMEIQLEIHQTFPPSIKNLVGL